MRDTDVMQRGFNRGTPPVQTAPVVRDWMTISTNTTLLLSTADVHKITLGANVTLTLDVSNVPDRTKVRVYLTQDGTGSRTVTWVGVTWLSGTAPTLTTTAAALDVVEFTFITQAAPTWIGRSLGKNINAPSATFATLHVTGVETLDGLLDLSAATAGQIKFPATQNPSGNANTFDDFERGSWTPIDASGAALAFAGVSGRYCKFADMVVAWGRVAYPVTVSGATSLIGGLPFTVASSPLASVGGGIISLTTVATLAEIGPTNTGVTVVQPRTSSGGGITNATMSGSDNYFCIIYPT